MWTCPECGSKVDPSFEVCWNCGTSVDGVRDPTFVKADDQPPIEDPPILPALDATESIPTGELPDPLRGEMVEAYRALDLVEANFLTEQLAGAGIHAVGDTHDFAHQAFSGVDAGPRVWVQEEDLPRARAWLESYEKNKVTPAES